MQQLRSADELMIQQKKTPDNCHRCLFIAGHGNFKVLWVFFSLLILKLCTGYFFSLSLSFTGKTRILSGRKINGVRAPGETKNRFFFREIKLCIVDKDLLMAKMGLHVFSPFSNCLEMITNNIEIQFVVKLY